MGGLNFLIGNAISGPPKPSPRRRPSMRLGARKTGASSPVAGAAVSMPGQLPFQGSLLSQIRDYIRYMDELQSSRSGVYDTGAPAAPFASPSGVAFPQSLALVCRPLQRKSRRQFSRILDQHGIRR